MIVRYDIKRIEEFISDFYNMTGITISFWDAEMNQLAFAPKDMPTFCRLIKSVPKGKKSCLFCDKRLIEECSKNRTPVTARCHAGLIDTAVPIIYKNQILAFILFGQIKDVRLTGNDDMLLLKSVSEDLKIPIQRLQNAYAALKSLEPYVIKSTTNILAFATLELLTSKTIDLSDHTFVTRINEYISENLQNPICVATICDEFEISKNRLYSLWKKHFNETIGDYILRIRMEKAKKLLTNTDEKISAICIKVGIPDYNYFSKLFKKFYGISCSEYRKKFPLILGDS